MTLLVRVPEPSGPVCHLTVEICRDCVVCGARHALRRLGRRCRQLLDAIVTLVWAVRLRCKLCGTWFTLLPAFVLPGHHYSARVIAGCVARPQAPVALVDPDRQPESSTIRRWARKFTKTCALAASRLVAAAATLAAGWKNVAISTIGRTDEAGDGAAAIP